MKQNNLTCANWTWGVQSCRLCNNTAWAVADYDYDYDGDQFGGR
jgi:hypothetical protein